MSFPLATTAITRSRGLPHTWSDRRRFRWLSSGRDMLAAMLRAISCARRTIRMEMYIFQPGQITEQFLAALLAARARGLRVRVLADAVGSLALGSAFWQPLVAGGGEFRRFNLPGMNRVGLRDHRKLMVCDEQVAFVGGVNIGPEYAGDGIRTGWRDLGLQLRGGVARGLAAAFDEMFELADFHHPPFAWLRHAVRQRRIEIARTAAILSAPGWRYNPMVQSLVEDFSTAQRIRILAAYFLPPRRVLRCLRRAALRGARVQLVLAGQTDVPLAQMAARGLYRRLLRAGVEIYEYQPQVLHAKMVLVDNHIVYAGSANLDVRSLHLNYELLLRIENRALAREAGDIFSGDLAHSRRIQYAEWVRSRRWWQRLFARLSLFFLAWLDPCLARQAWRR